MPRSAGLVTNAPARRIVACRPRRRLLRAPRHHAAVSKMSRSMFRVPAEPGLPSQAAHSTCPVLDALSRGCSHIERETVATPGGHAPCQAVASLCACHGIVLAYPCAASAPSSLRPRQETSVRRQARPGAEESLARRRSGVGLRSLPRWLEIDQERVRKSRENGWRKKNSSLPSRENPPRETGASASRGRHRRRTQ
jgi:hypothetical protein